MGKAQHVCSEAERGPGEGRVMEEGGGAGLEEAGLLGKGRISILSPGQRPLEALINILTILVYI